MPLDMSKDRILGVKFNAAEKVLIQKNLKGIRASVYGVIDKSASMGGWYSDGSVQHLGEQALALSAHFDDDGIVPTVFFDGRATDPVDLRVDQAAGAISNAMRNISLGGGTDYAAAMEKVIAHYQSSGATDPAFVIFQTDGADGNQRKTTKLLCDASELPIFWQFVGFGEDNPNSRYDEFAFLRKLDNIPVAGGRFGGFRRGESRKVDNAGFFAAGRQPKTLSDEELYNGLLNEYPQYLVAARAAGIVR